MSILLIYYYKINVYNNSLNAASLIIYYVQEIKYLVIPLQGQ